jgi:hypothetical protein
MPSRAGDPSIDEVPEYLEDEVDPDVPAEAPRPGLLRFARMAGSSIAGRDAALWVTDFLNGAYSRRPPEDVTSTTCAWPSACSRPTGTASRGADAFMWATCRRFTGRSGPTVSQRRSLAGGRSTVRSCSRAEPGSSATGSRTRTPTIAGVGGEWRFPRPSSASPTTPTVGCGWLGWGS